jgi:hypothetical protein
VFIVEEVLTFNSTLSMMWMLNITITLDSLFSSCLIVSLVHTVTAIGLAVCTWYIFCAI